MRPFKGPFKASGLPGVRYGSPRGRSPPVLGRWLSPWPSLDPLEIPQLVCLRVCQGAQDRGQGNELKDYFVCLSGQCLAMLYDF